MTTYDVFLADCPARTTLDLIGNTWTVVVLVALGEQPRGYSELRVRIGGISKKMLTQTLVRLRESGLVQQNQSRSYLLTDLGTSLLEPIEALVAWAETNTHRLVEGDWPSTTPGTPVSPATRVNGTPMWITFRPWVQGHTVISFRLPPTTRIALYGAELRTRWQEGDPTCQTPHNRVSLARCGRGRCPRPTAAATSLTPITMVIARGIWSKPTQRSMPRPASFGRPAMKKKSARKPSAIQTVVVHMCVS